MAVVLLDHISNFTDFNVLERHPQVNLYYAADSNDLADADIVILPGSKNTLSDLLGLRKRVWLKLSERLAMKGRP